MFAPALRATAATLVERGDTLNIEILEAPEFSRTAKVDVDGRIRLPGMAGIAVAGKDLDGVRQAVEEALGDAELIRRATVLVEIAAYRPVYVGGAVETPGAVEFEPGLTVRHALVLAGGPRRLDAAKPGGVQPGQIQEALARIRAVSYRLLQTESLIARLRAELERESDFTPETTGLSVSDASAEDIMALERGQLADRLGQLAAEDVHMANVLELVALEIDVLDQQAELQEREFALQEEEIENARSLLERGLIPLPRLQELEREGSRLSRDLLENHAFSARAKQTQETVRHDLEAKETETRIEVRRTLAGALGNRATLEAELESLRSFVRLAGLSVDGDERIAEPVPEVTIHRTTDGAARKVSATLDTPVEPGDLLDVTLATEPRG